MENLSQSFKSYLSQKEEARRFLKGMEDYLRERTGSQTKIRQEIDDTVQRAKVSIVERHLAFPEGAFLNLYAVPKIHQYLLTTNVGLTEEAARSALLSESYKHHPDIASDSPASKARHPFTKTIGEGLESIVTRWWTQDGGSSNSQSCPDLAIRPPCPFKIVFEGEYFRKGSPEAAKTDLVRNIYQCFFYLALPRVPTDGLHSSWEEYDYACLLAYDSSEQGNLRNAWQQIREEVRTGLWNGANIYVMVL